jgi:putative selenium metabolism hydrolase
MEFPVDSDGLVEFATQLARTPSESGSEGKAVEVATGWFGELGFDHVEIDEVGNAIGIIGSGGHPRLLIDGHIDTIPLHSPEKWTVDPFGGEIRNGKLYGLGICDQKGSIAAAAHGISAATREMGSLAGTVAVIGSVCEEAIEGAALSSFVERFGPDYAVTSEPSNTRLCIGQRGRAKVFVHVWGRACHAGHRSRGVNAAEALALMLAGIRGLENPTHPVLGIRDITCIDVASWPYPSVSTVPGEALARLDCRFLPGETPQSLIDTISGCANDAVSDWDEAPEIEVGLVRAEFSTWTGSKFQLDEFEPAWWTEERSPLVTGATAGLTSVGIDPTATHYSFCTNGSYLAGEMGIPTIGFGVGLEHMAHQVDENITLESLHKGAQGFASFVRQLVGGG